MSLIQQALERTSRPPETRTTTPAPGRKIWARDPMGAHLERELLQVQESHARRRSLYWKIAVGVLVVFFVTGLFLFGRWQAERSADSAAVSVRIYGGYIYRLTGITKSGNEATAVINNRLVGVGDALNRKAIVKSIEDGEVRLDIRGKEIILAL